jgi:hypothetical protein
MRIDLFRRSEDSGQFSYLAVPQGRKIPEEAANTDWELVQQDIELMRLDSGKTGLSVDDGESQIGKKGYAISSVTRLAGNGRGT